MPEQPSPAYDRSHWDERYRQRQTPWDHGAPAEELATAVKLGEVPAGSAVELGCGTGTNAVFLARAGFKVVGLDISPLALDLARQRAKQAEAAVEFIEADLGEFCWPRGPVDFVFDRGCYHCVRRVNLAGYLKTLEQVTRPGSQFLLLAGNANRPCNPGPPTVHEHEIRGELGTLFEFTRIRQCHFEDIGDGQRPLAWSCLATRR